MTVLKAALASLELLSTRPVRVSSFYLTKPIDCPVGSPDFINAVAEISVVSNRTPEELLTRLKEIEIALGRQPKTILNEARTLDLDLIAFGSEVRKSNELILPHPRAHQRAFVLAPLAELNPELILMGQETSVICLWEEFPDRDSVRIIL